ncbi:hypothetical protein RhiJN_24398 [Ceratobasidium sp. AG-Ba]|nr:hypothetical protein RhiJN_24398 [Ceratobasidium sp. AG-Ba]
MPKDIAKQLKSKLKEKGITIRMVNGEIEIDMAESVLGLPTGGQALNFVVRDKPPGCPGRGEPEGYNLEVQSGMNKWDFKLFKELATAVLQRTPAVDLTKPYSSQMEAITLCVNKFRKMQPEFEAYKDYGYWIIYAVFQTLMRNQSGQTKTAEKKTNEMLTLMAQGVPLPKITDKPLKKRGRPRKNLIVVKDEPPIAALPVPLSPQKSDSDPTKGIQVAAHAPPPPPDEGEVIDLDGAEHDVSMVEASRSFADMAIDPDILTGGDDDEDDDGPINLDEAAGTIPSIDNNPPCMPTPAPTPTPGSGSAPAPSRVLARATSTPATSLAPAPAMSPSPSASPSLASACSVSVPAPLLPPALSQAPSHVPACATSTPATSTSPAPTTSPSVSPMSARSTPALGPPPASSPAPSSPVLSPSAPDPASVPATAASLASASESRLIESPAPAPITAPQVPSAPPGFIVWRGLKISNVNMAKICAVAACKAAGLDYPFVPIYKDLVDKLAKDPDYDPSSDPDPVSVTSGHVGTRNRGGTDKSKPRPKMRPVPEPQSVQPVESKPSPEPQPQSEPQPGHTIASSSDNSGEC